MKGKEVFYKKNLYPIRVADYLSDSGDRFVLYSPLAHSLGIMNRMELDGLAKELEFGGCFADTELQQQLIEAIEEPRPNFVTNPEDVFALTILPNNICNFSCSYCYAAKGHGKDELSEETLKTVLDFFVDPRRITRRDLYISFGGGGEPLLSWEKVKFAIAYSDSLARKYGFIIKYSYASNGSVISDEILHTIHTYDIKVNISFDILEEIQNIQRKNYEKVCQTLDCLLENDICPTINSVITPLNVARQSEMVEEIHSRFPKLRRLSFDYVVDANLYRESDSLRTFYDHYMKHFFEARTLGKHYNITVSSIKCHNLEQIKTRACAGGFDLTPQGKFSMCFFVSSPKEALYEDFIYGSVDSGKLEFDHQKFKSLVEFSSNDREKCRDCFIRWHCGGGCFYHIKSYTAEMLEVMCEFQRKFSLVSLLNDATGHNNLTEE